MLAPHWDEGSHRAELQTLWQSKRKLRLEYAFDADIINAVYQALPQLPFALSHSKATDLGFQYWKAALDGGHSLPPPIHNLVEWLSGPAIGWVSEITGCLLGRVPTHGMAACLYTKGSFLETHNDLDATRVIAFVVGLTPTSWPASEGGHLCFHAGQHATEPVEQRPPGYNTLDLFDVQKGDCWHSVPIVRSHLQRYTIAGWFHRPPDSEPSTVSASG